MYLLAVPLRFNAPYGRWLACFLFQEYAEYPCFREHPQIENNSIEDGDVSFISNVCISIFASCFFIFIAFFALSLIPCGDDVRIHPVLTFNECTGISYLRKASLTNGISPGDE